MAYTTYKNDDSGDGLLFFNHITHKLDYVFKHESRYKTFVHLLITIFPNIASDVKYNAVNITFYPLVI